VRPNTRRDWRRAAARGLGVLVALLAAGQAAAHVVVGRSSLRQFLQHSASSLRVRFLGDAQVWVAPGGRDRQEVFRVRVLEHLAGEPAAPVGGELAFFPHAEGFPAFRQGDEALLFLEPSSAAPEFAGLAEHLPWYSLQGAGEEWRLQGSDGKAIAAQARGWAAWLTRDEPGVAELRRLLHRSLASGVSRLERDGLTELLRVRDLPGLLEDEEAVAPFASLVRGEGLPLRRRAALLRALEGRAGVAREEAWRELFAQAADPAEQLALVRLAGSSPAPAVREQLVELAGAGDGRVRAAAVRALAGARDPALLTRLAEAAGDPEARVARAAVEGLSALQAHPAARGRLEELAAGEGERARWARAALRRAAAAP